VKREQQSDINERDSEIDLLNAELDNLTSLYLDIHEGMDISSFLDALLDNLRDIVLFDGANVAFIDEHDVMTIHKVRSDKISPRSKLSPDYLEKIYAEKIDYKTGELLACICAREKIELYYPEIDPEDFDGIVKERILNYGITSLYYLPIVSKRRVLGVMRFHNYGGTMFLSESEKKIIRRRVAVVARAMENFILYDELKKKTMLIEQDLDLARRLQQNMLPSEFPRIPGVTIVLKYIPMHEVGGDFVDFIYPAKENNKSLGILVTDASGHGVSAAFVASMLKVLFGSDEVEDVANEPARVLGTINQRISGKIADNFVTAAYCFLDLQSKSLIVSSAGHNDIILIDKNSQTMKKINPRGKPLGLFNDLHLDEESSSLSSPKRLIVYTDGLTEATDSSGEEFEKYFLELCISDVRTSAYDFAEKAEASLFDHIGRGRKNIDDDVALVVIDID